MGDLHTRADPFPPLSITKAVAGTVFYPPGGKLGPRIQQDLQLVLLHTGKMVVWVDGTKQSIPAGHLILLHPGHKESFAFAKNEETWHRWIAVTLESYPSDLLSIFKTTPFYLPISDEMNQLTDLMLSIQRSVTTTPQDTAQQANDVLQPLGLSALKLYYHECRKADLFQRTHSAVLIAKSIIHERYREDLTLSDLALVASISKDHLIRLFQKHEDLTPTQYLWQYRIERGIELLRNTGLSISEIADRTGFKTSYHFARSIKKQSGRTPTEVRKESWGGE